MRNSSGLEVLNSGREVLSLKFDSALLGSVTCNKLLVLNSNLQHDPGQILNLSMVLNVATIRNPSHLFVPAFPCPVQ